MPSFSPPTLVMLLVVAWAQFAFVSGRLNPLVRPRLSPLRRRWRYGCRMGIAVLLGGTGALSAHALTSLHTIAAAGLGISIYAVIAIPATIASRSRALHRGASSSNPTLR